MIRRGEGAVARAEALRGIMTDKGAGAGDEAPAL